MEVFLFVYWNNIKSDYVPLISNLQVVAVKIFIGFPIIICNIYLPQNNNVSLDEINSILNQINSPFLFLGGFNARNPIFGGDILDSRGKMLETCFLNNIISFLNYGSSTYFSLAHGSFSTIV